MVRKCECGNCGAKLEFEENREFAFCQYCGTKVILDDYRSVHRYVDEAKIKESDVKEKIILKELELEEKRREEEKQERKAVQNLAIKIGIIGIVMIVVGCFLGSLTGDGDSPFYWIGLIGFFPTAGAIFLWCSKK